MYFINDRFFKFSLALLILEGTCIISFSQNHDLPESLVLKPLLINKDIVWTFDSLMRLKIFSYADSQKENNKTSPPDETKSMKFSELPDVLFEYRFEEMNRISVIHFDYNPDVRRYIELFADKRKDSYSHILGLSRMYFPLFEEYLEKHRLPLELKYLPVIESALNPLARSTSDAIGLWQFKLHASRMFNLEVNSVIDERMDPRKSTEAACQYLEYLYSIFRDWQLAVAAFNGGPGVVRNAIERSGGKTNFWAIRSYMPQQTQDYVPAFIAAAYMMNYADKHNIDPVYPDYDFWHTDTVMLNYTIQLQQISDIIDVPLDALRFLNPMYKAGFIPEMGRPMVLMLPSEKVLVFIRHENDILGRKLEVLDYNKARINSASTDNKIKGIYTVRNGDFLHKIAYEHNCSIEDIRVWNNLKDDTLKPGQLIVYWSLQNEIKSKINDDSLKFSKSYITPVKFSEHKVLKGETLYTIAGKYKGASIQEIMNINGIKDEKSINIGQVLKIPIHE
jgi:membrane-bound lytic murein transglycosylase D